MITVADTVRDTWRLPPAQKSLLIRLSRAGSNSSPMVKRSMTTPISAKVWTVSVFLTKDRPPGPMRTPVRRKPTTDGSLSLWEI